MQFIVMAFDGTDDQAFSRRLSVREDHLARADEMYRRGTILYASGILGEDGRLIGSMIVCDFPSREELESRWLRSEPYVLGKVWERIEIHRAQVAPFCAPK